MRPKKINYEGVLECYNKGMRFYDIAEINKCSVKSVKRILMDFGCIKVIEGTHAMGRSICWECRRATGFCSWSKKFRPVKGWDAEKFLNFEGLSTYLVKVCPLFVPDRERGVYVEECEV